MHHKRVVYPFMAIVGQERMKKSLILNAINPQISGVLIRGKKGTAKSTAARGLADLLPEIEVVADCPFNCNPHELREMCESCQKRYKSGKKLPIKRRKMFVVDMPVSATEDRVVGTLDIEKAIKRSIKALEPGVLADANRGILYIDEVNLLDDHVADALLDSAAMGVNVIEREGISVYHPSQFILIGTMNPEEGDLRPQLLDRFGLCVQIENIQDVEQRMKIVEFREQFDANQWEFRTKFESKQKYLRKKILNARKILPKVTISEELLRLIARVCVDLNVDGHRADILIAKTAKTIAAFEGREKVLEDDVQEAMMYALPHRMRRKPFEEIKLSKYQFKKALEDAKQKDDIHGEGTKTDRMKSEPTIPKEQVFDIGAPTDTRKVLRVDKDKIFRNSAGKRAKTLTKSKRGRYIKPKIPRAKVNDIAFDATLRAAALQQPKVKELGIKIKKEHLREKVREGRASALVTFVVDASGSMGAQERMKAAKGAAFSLLTDVYEKRDKVAMVAFRGDRGEMLLSPTRSVDLAKTHLRELPTGGKTPLPAGILEGIDVIKNELKRNDSLIPMLVLITDGKGNVPIRDNVLEDLNECAREISEKSFHVVVIDAEFGSTRLGLARNFAEKCGGKYYTVDELNGEKIAEIVKTEIRNPTLQ